MLVWRAGWGFSYLQHLTITFIITYYIISKSNGAEGDKGEVEAFSVTPAFNITEDHWWKNQEE